MLPSTSFRTLVALIHYAAGYAAQLPVRSGAQAQVTSSRDCLEVFQRRPWGLVAALDTATKVSTGAKCCNSENEHAVERYYRRFVGYDAYPSGLGLELASVIPRNPEELAGSSNNYIVYSSTNTTHRLDLGKGSPYRKRQGAPLQARSSRHRLSCGLFLHRRLR